MIAAPQTKAQWIGFAVWFLGNSIVEFHLGKKQPLGAGSIIELITVFMTWVFNLFRRKKYERSTEVHSEGNL